MSADNGVYILESEGPEYRVIHAQAIENLWWNPDTNEEEDNINPQQLLSYYGEAEVFTDRDKSFKFAKELHDEYPFTEYGICFIEYKDKFPVSLEVKSK